MPSVDLLTVLDIAGVVVFAMTGCLVAARRGVDIIGFALLAMVTGVGGGTLRDVLLGRLPVFWVDEPSYLWVCFATAIVMFWAVKHIAMERRWLVWADGLGLALYAVLGCRIALDTDAPAIVCVFMGVMTATFGGIIRDLLAGEPTLIFRRELYVTAAVLGASLYYALLHFGIPQNAAMTMAVTAAFALRGAAIYWRLTLPGYGDASVSTPHPHRRGSISHPDS